MAKVANQPLFPMPFLVIFLVLSIMSGFGITLSEAVPKVRHYKWEVEYMFRSPDCVENIVMGINGQFPGPTIRANIGDTIVVEMINKLSTEGLVIHWHGILQRGTPRADGTASISQCATNPGETFIYRFVVDKAGTYFYHGHLGMQRAAGLYGSLIVDLEEGKKEPFHYDEDINLLLIDSWHKTVQKQEVSLNSNPMHWINEPEEEIPNWDDYDRSKNFTYRILAAIGSPKPPVKSNRRIFLLNTQNHINGSFVKWAINNVSLALPPTPYLAAIRIGLNTTFDQNPPPETFPEDYDIYNPPPNTNTKTGNGVYRFELGEIVDVILQNANTLEDKRSEIHPWHLHGHDFWVLGYGEGKFSAAVDEKKLNLKTPPLRNTVVIFPYGWTAIRFVADNPGGWAFHCHIEPHLHMGMGFVIAEGAHKVGMIPTKALACGGTAKVLIHNPTIKS
ncbi:unnamed protein product [Citrullus colocynthis]|uniref:L-ascorbate oxidase n=1 Tax=Citrullus colocynthis TaxID=252529 RepID=A0ABP0Z7K7_9ROSI